MDEIVFVNELEAYTHLVTCQVVTANGPMPLDQVDVKSGGGGPGNYRLTHGKLLAEGYTVCQKFGPRHGKLNVRLLFAT